MGLILSTAAGLMLIPGGTYGIDLLLERYATPEVRMQARPTASAAEEPQRVEKPAVATPRRSYRR